MEGELGKVDNFGEQLPPELIEFLAKIIIPLQGFILDDLKYLSGKRNGCCLLIQWLTIQIPVGRTK